MKHRFLTLAAVVAAIAFPSAARAACGAIPYTFTNGVTIVDATTTNANNVFLQGCATQVDYTQMGPAGIWASQIIPNSPAHATFGGSWGYTFSPGTTSQVPLTVAGASGQTADIFDVTTTLGPAFSVGSSGGVTADAGSGSVTPLIVRNSNTPSVDIFRVVRGSATVLSVDAGGHANVGVALQSLNPASDFFLASNAVAAGGAVAAFTFSNYNATPFRGDFVRFVTGGGSNFTIQDNAVPKWNGSNGVSVGDTGTVTNTMLANKTISGVALGSNLFLLTPGAHLSGGAYNGSAAIPLTTDATNANTASTIVARDGAGAFSMGALTATTINASSTVTGGSFAMIGTDTGLDFSNGTMITRRASDGHLRLNSQNSVTEVVGALTATTTITGTNHIANAAAASGGAGTVSYGGTTATTVGAAGGASALPATPVGYVIINVAGTNYKLPYYNN